MVLLYSIYAMPNIDLVNEGSDQSREKLFDH